MRIRTLLSSSIALFLAVVGGVAGCSSDDGGGGTGGSTSTSSATTSSAGGGSSTTSSTSSTSGTGGAGPECMGPGQGEAPAPQLVNSVKARLLDLDGNPIGGLAVQLCGLDICLFGESEADGSVVVAAANKMLDHPVFKFGDGVGYVRFPVPVPDQPDVELGDVVTAALPDIATGQAMTAGGTAESNGFKLEFASPASIEVDVLTFGEEDQQKLRAVEIPIDKPAAIQATEGFVELWGATPFETLFCPAAKLTVPNTADLPADSAVEFYALGVGVNEDWLKYGHFTLVSGGKVSADGATISTNDGEGIPELSIIGIKPVN